MNKDKHFQNCLSKEMRTYQSNINKYKRLMEMEIKSKDAKKSVESENPQKLYCMTANENFIPQPIAITSADCSYNLAEETVVSKIDGKNQDIIAILNKINNRLEKIEKTQFEILNNQSILSQGQGSITAKQQCIVSKLEEIEANMATKPEMLAQTKLLMECKVSIKRVDDYVCRITGKTRDTEQDDIESMLPLKTLVEVRDLEERLQGKQDFCDAMKLYLHGVKGGSEEVSSVIRELFTDELLRNFNWDGRWGKESLVKLHLINETVRSVFQNQRNFNFEGSVKKAVELGHHRVKQKEYKKKKQKIENN